MLMRAEAAWIADHGTVLDRREVAESGAPPAARIPSSMQAMLARGFEVRNGLGLCEHGLPESPPRLASPAAGGDVDDVVHERGGNLLRHEAVTAGPPAPGCRAWRRLGVSSISEATHVPARGRGCDRTCAADGARRTAVRATSPNRLVIQQHQEFPVAEDVCLAHQVAVLQAARHRPTA